jgi:acyl carrier protein
MTNKERYNKAFIESFGIAEEALNHDLCYQSIEAWDSVGHMSLIATLEDEFEIEMEMDDIIDFSSYEKGMELVMKYGIQF